MGPPEKIIQRNKFGQTSRPTFLWPIRHWSTLILEAKGTLELIEFDWPESPKHVPRPTAEMEHIWLM